MPFTVTELRQLAQSPDLTEPERREVLTLLSQATLNIDKPSSEGGRKLGSRMGRGIEIAGGLIPNPLIRLPAMVVGGALSSLSEGQSLKETAKRVGTNIAAEGVFPGLGGAARHVPKLLSGISNLAPEAALHVALRVGGLRGKQATKAVGAFLRERQRSPLGQALVPGSMGRAAQRRETVGNRLQQVEDASSDVINPVSATKDAFANVNPRLFGRTNLGAARRQAKRSQIAFRRSYPNAPMSMRETGTLARAQQSEATRLIEQRSGMRPPGASKPQPSAPDEMMAAERGALLRQAQNTADPIVAQTNRQLADIHTIENALTKMRGGGSILGELGAMSVRGGMGGALGYLVGGAPGAAYGGLGLGLGLNPRVLTNIGFGTGRAAALIPTIARLMEQSAIEEARRNQR